MDLHHSFTVPADVDTAWTTLMDLEGVAGCFPGAAITGFDDDAFTGTVKVKLGPIALVYSGSGTFVERDDTAHRAVIDAKGKDKRGNGTAGAMVTIAVTDAAGGGSEVDVTTDLNVTGKPAQFGRGVMQDVSDKLLGQFVTCLEKRFEAGEGPATEEEAAAAPTPAAPSGAKAAPAATSPDMTAETSTTTGTSAAATATVPDAAAPAAPRAAVAPSRRAAPVAEPDDALDLGATVLPVILRSYAPQIAVGVVGLVVGIIIGSRIAR
ncbi:MAG: SRPBCC family protein, partial [Lapillicoccus sp.]